MNNYDKIIINYFSDTHQKVESFKYVDQDGEFSVMNAQLFFERRILYYNFNFVVPCVLITLLVIGGFALPCECGEKIGLRNYSLHSNLTMIIMII